MIAQINSSYEELLQKGKKVYEIEISPIGFDHLTSELLNQKEKPQWSDYIRVKNEIRGFVIRSRD
jgi:hypothetical protein